MEGAPGKGAQAKNDAATHRARHDEHKEVHHLLCHRNAIWSSRARACPPYGHLRHSDRWCGCHVLNDGRVLAAQADTNELRRLQNAIVDGVFQQCHACNETARFRFNRFHLHKEVCVPVVKLKHFKALPIVAAHSIVYQCNNKLVAHRIYDALDPCVGLTRLGSGGAQHAGRV